MQGSPPKSPPQSSPQSSPQSPPVSPEIEISDSIGLSHSQIESPTRESYNEYFLFHSGIDDSSDQDTCMLKMFSDGKIIFIRYSFTLLCHKPNNLDVITGLSQDEQEIIYKNEVGAIVRTRLGTDDFSACPPHQSITLSDIPEIKSGQRLINYDELMIQGFMPKVRKFFSREFDETASVVSGSSGITENAQGQPVLHTMTTRSHTMTTRSMNPIEQEYYNLSEIIVSLYGLSDAIQVSLGKLHNSLNTRSDTAENGNKPFEDIVCDAMAPFCAPSSRMGDSKSFDQWLETSEADKKKMLMCLKSAYVSRAENSCKVHDKPEVVILQKMNELYLSDIRPFLIWRSSGNLEGILNEMDQVFSKHFRIYMESTKSASGGVSQEKCRLAITDYQTIFAEAMDQMECPIPRYDRLGEMVRTRSSRLEKTLKNANLGFNEGMQAPDAEENVATSMVSNAQALVCDAINHADFTDNKIIAHLNSSEIDAARLSLDIQLHGQLRPLVILIEHPDYSDDKNVCSAILPIPCDFRGDFPPPPTLRTLKIRELHEGDGGLFVFLSIPWFEVDHYRSEWFSNLKRDDKSKVIRPIICVYKVTETFPPNEGYEDALRNLHNEFIHYLTSEQQILASSNRRLFENCRVPKVKPIIMRQGIQYSFVFGISTTKSGVSNNLTLALILPHLSEGGGEKCFRGTCDARECIRLLNHSGCSYLHERHFTLRNALLLSLTKLNFLLGLILKEYGDSTKAVCAEIMRSYGISSILASVDWCLLLRQYEGVGAFRTDKLFKITGTTELKTISPEEIRKIATLQALIMCYARKDELNSGNISAQLALLQGNETNSREAAINAYRMFQSSIQVKLNRRIIEPLEGLLERYRGSNSIEILSDYCEFVLFHSKLQTTNFLVDEDRFVSMISKPVTSHGRHICHDMLDFFEKYVIDTRKIDSFEYERMKLIHTKDTKTIENLLTKIHNIPLNNPYIMQRVNSLKTGNSAMETTKESIKKQIESDMIGIFSNCSLFELLLLVNHFNKNVSNFNFKTSSEEVVATTPRQEANSKIPPFNVADIKRLLNPSLWTLFHEFFGAECGVTDFTRNTHVSKIATVIQNAGYTYLSPEHIAGLKAPKNPIQTPLNTDTGDAYKKTNMKGLKSSARQSSARQSPARQSSARQSPARKSLARKRSARQSPARKSLGLAQSRKNLQSQGPAKRRYSQSQGLQSKTKKRKTKGGSRQNTYKISYKRKIHKTQKHNRHNHQ